MNIKRYTKFPFQSGLLSSTFIICFHLIALVTLYLILYELEFIDNIPDEFNLVRYDAFWYASIKEEGYDFVPGVGNNLAFFPMFPLIWSLLKLNAFQISVFNVFIFSISFAVLFKDCKLDFYKLLYLLSFPSFIFFALPYSESVFFFCCTLIILGYRRKSNLYIYLGLFFLSTVRSVCVILIPALLLLEFLYIDKSENKSKKLTRLLWRLTTSISGLISAMYYVYLKTGTWFYFIEIQKYWNRHWSIPKFPLTTNDPSRILAVDGITFLIGIVSVYIIIKRFFEASKSYLNKDISFNNSSKIILLSSLYVAGMTLIDLFFTFSHEGSTNIWSLNRHVMCSPFAMLFIIYIIDEYILGRKEIIAICLLIFSGIYFTGLYQYKVLTCLYILYFMNLYILKYQPNYHKFIIVSYLISIICQLKFYDEFLMGYWLG